jgi:hypothetical protein
VHGLEGGAKAVKQPVGFQAIRQQGGAWTIIVGETETQDASILPIATKSYCLEQSLRISHQIPLRFQFDKTYFATSYYCYLNKVEIQQLFDY